MKKLFIFSAIAVCAVLATSCGNAKKVGETAAKSPKDEVSEWAASAPEGKLRGFGTGMAGLLEEKYARRDAEMMARQEIARAISTAYDEVEAEYRQKYSKSNLSSGANGPSSEDARDNKGKNESEGVTEAHAVVAGAPIRIARSETLPSGVVVWYVGVETDLETVAKYLSESAAVKDLISKQDKNEIDKAQADFEKRMEERLNSRRNTTK